MRPSPLVAALVIPLVLGACASDPGSDAGRSPGVDRPTSSDSTGSDGPAAQEPTAATPGPGRFSPTVTPAGVRVG